MIIANTPAAIGADKSSVQIRTTGGKWLKIPQASKITIAKKIISLVNVCSVWASVDNFLPHLCACHGLTPGVVVFSKSDPSIFGYEHNVNILKSREHLRVDQWGRWAPLNCPCDQDAFPDAGDVARIILSKA